MSDFTKEELQYLLEMIDSIRIVNREIDDDELQDKIQSMIDNYCDHKKNLWPLYTAQGDLPAGAICYECNQVVDKEFLNE